MNCLRTFLAFLLMIFLPLQASWSAAAVFCYHENESKITWHWGHHAPELDIACQEKASFKYKDNDKASKSQPNLASHSDHLNINHHAVEQQPLSETMLRQFAYSIHFTSNSTIFYQSPVLEQPEPPLWSV